MAYTKYYNNGWADTSSGGTPIRAAALNNMENGITNAHDLLDAKPAKIVAGASAVTVSVPANSTVHRWYAFSNGSPSVTFNVAPKVFIQLTGGGYEATGDASAPYVGTDTTAYRGQVGAFVHIATTTGFAMTYYNASNAELQVGLTWLAVGS